MKTLTIAQGNTYSCKESLKAAGFIWNAGLKRFEAENFDQNKWNEKYCSATWNGRGKAKYCQAITFKTVEVNLEEGTY